MRYTYILLCSCFASNISNTTILLNSDRIARRQHNHRSRWNRISSIGIRSQSWSGRTWSTMAYWQWSCLWRSISWYQWRIDVRQPSQQVIHRSKQKSAIQKEVLPLISFLWCWVQCSTNHARCRNPSWNCWFWDLLTSMSGFYRSRRFHLLSQRLVQKWCGIQQSIRYNPRKHKKEKMECSSICFDGSLESEPASDSTTIVNGAPMIDLSINATGGLYNDSTECIADIVEPDGDTYTQTYAWSINARQSARVPWFYPRRS